MAERSEDIHDHLAGLTLPALVALFNKTESEARDHPKFQPRRMQILLSIIKRDIEARLGRGGA